jgi:hypothetical protein
VRCASWYLVVVLVVSTELGGATYIYNYNWSASSKGQGTRQTLSNINILLKRKTKNSIMGWFGGGSSSASSSSSSSSAMDFRSEDTNAFQGSTNFASPSSSSSSSSNTAELEQFSVALQHQMLVQAVITSMSDTAFNRCVQGKPGDSLSGRDVACIHATVGKWLDTNEFMMGRMAKKEEALINKQ